MPRATRLSSALSTLKVSLATLCAVAVFVILTFFEAKSREAVLESSPKCAFSQQERATPLSMLLELQPCTPKVRAFEHDRDWDPKWYVHENVCVSGVDGTPLYKPDSQYQLSLSKFQLNSTDVTPPFRPRAISEIVLEASTPFTWLAGSTVVVQCWQLAKGVRNPVHFLFAYGKLFELFQRGKRPFKVDVVILHQCTDPIDAGPFFRMIRDVVYESGLRHGYVNTNTKFISIPAFETSTLFCAAEMYVEHSLAFFNGGKNQVEDMKLEISQLISTTDKIGLFPTTSELGVRRQSLECRSSLRFGVYTRPETDVNRREITNRDAVMSVIQRFSTHRAIDVSVLENESVEDTFRKFNSFDILVTTHGSHLTNFLFTAVKFAVVEITAIDWMPAAYERSVWSALIPNLYVCFPHNSSDRATQAIIDASFSRSISAEEMVKVKNAGIEVNLQRLEETLHTVVHDFCDVQEQS